MSKAEEYYYQHLNKSDKIIYHAIKTGLLSLDASILVPRIDMRSLTEIFFLVRLDHPEIFYTETFKARAYKNADSLEMFPDYLFPKKQIKAHQQAMQSRIQKLVRPALQMSEREKEQYVHDFICENVTYDKLKKAYSHEIIGPLAHGIGVCEGIAKTVKVLCDALGLWCIIPLSDNNPEKKIKYRHTWNLIRIGGKYYHMDATFDASLSRDGIIRYDYFNVDDTNFFRDHEPVIWRIPECTDSKMRYYVEKKMSFTTLEEVRKRCAQAVKKNKDFIFHWRGGYLTKEILMELMKIFREEGRKKEKHAYLSLNWAQAVCRVHFDLEKENMAHQDLIMEVANEGEKEEL